MAQHDGGGFDAFDPHGSQPPAADPPGTALDVLTPQVIAGILRPHAIPYRDWAAALLNDDEFEEGDDGGGVVSIIAAILTAETSEQALAATDMQNAVSLIGEEPGARSGWLEIYDGIPLKTTYEKGAPCFAVISYVDLETGTRRQFSCGARAVQGVLLKHMWQGWLPFRCVLTRRRKPTRSGFYPLNLEAGG
jgi:hypothetical protein